MNRTIKRLILALIVSCACFGATVYWYQSGNTDDQSTHTVQPVALLSSSVNEVQRKPVRRMIWESVSRNDDLYPGEAIRTASNSEANIELIKGGAVIHLDPDSLVVLDRDAQGLNLDFLRGNLFVEGGSNSSGLTLKAGDNQIHLQSASMSLSKRTDGKINLEVYRGRAELNHAGNTVAISRDKSAVISQNGLSQTRDAIRLLAPKAGARVPLNLNRREPLVVKWKALPAGYTMSVELGARRSKLETQPNLSADGNAGQLQLPVRPGRWFLRLVAQPIDSHLPRLASLTIPVTIRAEAPPVLVQPRSTVIRTSVETPLTFQWANRYRFKTQEVQIARDPRFQKLVLTKVPRATKFSGLLEDGEYYWRVTGYLRVRGKTEALTSNIVAFSVRSHWQLNAPILLSPENQQRLSIQDVENGGLILKWKRPPEVESFDLKLQRKGVTGWSTIFHKQTPASEVRFTKPLPGAYRWSVASLDPKGGPAKSSAVLRFLIMERPKLQWADASLAIEYDFKTETPTLAAKWIALKPSPSAYNFKVVPAGEDLASAPWQTTRETSFQIPLAAEGQYLGLVEAVDADGRVLAESDHKEFVVKRAPLLPAPKWVSQTPSVLKASLNGDLNLGWEPVKGAQNYVLILKSPEGAVVRQTFVKRTTASLSQMKPGDYEAYVRTVDESKRAGPPSEKRVIHVPAKTDIQAPKIRAIRVK